MQENRKIFIHHEMIDGTTINCYNSSPMHWARSTARTYAIDAVLMNRVVLNIATTDAGVLFKGWRSSKFL